MRGIRNLKSRINCSKTELATIISVLQFCLIPDEFQMDIMKILKQLVAPNPYHCLYFLEEEKKRSYQGPCLQVIRFYFIGSTYTLLNCVNRFPLECSTTIPERKPY
jgi:hypothetical protein